MSSSGMERNAGIVRSFSAGHNSTPVRGLVEERPKFKRLATLFKNE